VTPHTLIELRLYQGFERAAQSLARCCPKGDGDHRRAWSVLARCSRVGHRGSRTVLFMRYERSDEYAL